MDDGIKLCEKCGNYTTGRLCRSCAEQEMIDREPWLDEPQKAETRGELTYGQVTELKRVGNEIVHFMKERGAHLDEDECAEACKTLLSSFEHLERVNQAQHRALRKIADAAINELEDER